MTPYQEKLKRTSNGRVMELPFKTFGPRGMAFVKTLLPEAEKKETITQSKNKIHMILNKSGKVIAHVENGSNMEWLESNNAHLHLWGKI